MVKWSTLLGFSKIPVRTIALPASVIVPTLALVLDAVGRLPDSVVNSSWSFQAAKELAEIVKASGYAPLLFWLYVSALLFTAFIVILEAACPRAIKQYVSRDAYTSDMMGMMERLPKEATNNEVQSRLEIIKSAREAWEKAEWDRPITRAIACGMLGISLLIIGFGTFVYVPHRVLQYDNMGRLFCDFVIICR